MRHLQDKLNNRSLLRHVLRQPVTKISRKDFGTFCVLRSCITIVPNPAQVNVMRPMLACIIQSLFPLVLVAGWPRLRPMNSPSFSRKDTRTPCVLLPYVRLFQRYGCGRQASLGRPTTSTAIPDTWTGWCRLTRSNLCPLRSLHHAVPLSAIAAIQRSASGWVTEAIPCWHLEH